jgi:hypothetical protein
MISQVTKKGRGDLFSVGQIQKRTAMSGDDVASIEFQAAKVPPPSGIKEKTCLNKKRPPIDWAMGYLHLLIANQSK